MTTHQIEADPVPTNKFTHLNLQQYRYFTITMSTITLIYHGTWYGTCDYVTPNRGYLDPTNQITDASLKLYRSDSSNNINNINRADYPA